MRVCQAADTITSRLDMDAQALKRNIEAAWRRASFKSEAEFARALKMKPSSLSGIKSRNVGLNNLLKVAAGAGCSLESLAAGVDKNYDASRAEATQRGAHDEKVHSNGSLVTSPVIRSGIDAPQPLSGSKAKKGVADESANRQSESELTAWDAVTVRNEVDFYRRQSAAMRANADEFDSRADALSDLATRIVSHAVSISTRERGAKRARGAQGVRRDAHRKNRS